MAQTQGNRVYIEGMSIIGGAGSPSGITEPVGSLYLRSDATSTTTRLYINTGGSTVWTAFTAIA